MGNFRLQKVEHQITQIVSELILKGEIKDHRVNSMLSISAVEVSRDLAYARIHISAFLKDRELGEAVEGLNSAAGFIQRQLGKRMRTRNTPKLTFVRDDGISKGFEVTQKLKELNVQQQEPGEDDPSGSDSHT
ncbi:30S ribosome-binding factor RbfA [Salinispira pacifica]|uniref:Ribosome-binding factor A n=1 Tax=Salinispira pacifica TaxID=1307761 RepID=V5WH81_9SPIO|nr:30S ribosome-binding factor RbfA [Salinispira pacifica]AHC15187.1 Ribosome-binding factor A [Salinispira pacifica]